MRIRVGAARGSVCANVPLHRFAPRPSLSSSQAATAAPGVTPPPRAWNLARMRAWCPRETIGGRTFRDEVAGASDQFLGAILMAAIRFHVGPPSRCCGACCAYPHGRDPSQALCRGAIPAGHREGERGAAGSRRHVAAHSTPGQHGRVRQQGSGCGSAYAPTAPEVRPREGESCRQCTPLPWNNLLRSAAEPPPRPGSEPMFAHVRSRAVDRSAGQSHPLQRG